MADSLLCHLPGLLDGIQLVGKQRNDFTYLRGTWTRGVSKRGNSGLQRIMKKIWGIMEILIILIVFNYFIGAYDFKTDSTSHDYTLYGYFITLQLFLNTIFLKNLRKPGITKIPQNHQNLYFLNA